MATMELLLKVDVENLGTRGQIVRVRAGYGRNYLLPQNLAVEATPTNVNLIERQRQHLLKLAAQELATAKTSADQLTSTTLTFARKVGAHGLLYGSVTAMDIAEALKAQGTEIERRKILLKDPIKEPGEYEVAVKLHAEVKPLLKIVVVPEETSTTPEAAAK